MEEVKDPDQLFKDFHKLGVVDINDTHDLSMTQSLLQSIIFKVKRDK